MVALKHKKPQNTHNAEGLKRGAQMFTFTIQSIKTHQRLQMWPKIILFEVEN